MSSGEFVIGLMTIITGLAIADMIVSLHGLLLNRRRIEWDWLSLLVALLVFLIIVATWGVYFRDFASEPPNPPLWRFSVILVQAIAIYLAARASLPDDVSSEGCRLADHYEQVSSYLWASLSFTYLIYIGSKLSRLGWSAIVDPYLLAALQLLLMVVLVFVRQRRIHALLTPVVVALFCLDHLMEPMFG
jgi:xanthine/uracil permease